MNIEDIRIGEDAYVISEKRTGVVTEIKKKKNSDHYIITVEYDDGSETKTTANNIDEPKYRVTPLGIMWCSLCDVLGEDFSIRDNSHKLAAEILEKFINGMTEAELLVEVDEKEKEEDI